MRAFTPATVCLAIVMIAAGLMPAVARPLLPARDAGARPRRVLNQKRSWSSSSRVYSRSSVQATSSGATSSVSSWSSSSGPQPTTSTTSPTTAPSTSPATGTATTSTTSPRQPAPTATSSPTAPSSSTGSSWSAAVLAKHNEMHARHGAAPLSWSATLASGAQSWADACNFKHSSGNWGENLAMGYADPVVAVQVEPPKGDPLRSLRLLDASGESLWWRCHVRTTTSGLVMERMDRGTLHEAVRAGAFHQEMETGDIGVDLGAVADVSHFTQIVWKGSTQLGCGFASGCKMLVCRYSPPGNMIGSFGANVSPAQ
ncbi:MAG: CAP domain-containing protein [Monoraphidium minutum]|nr:MAG: CAP domain-containing protein [Monoraphidium minutum]